MNLQHSLVHLFPNLIVSENIRMQVVLPLETDISLSLPHVRLERAFQKMGNVKIIYSNKNLLIS